MKKTFYSELTYVIGIITLALGTALMERSDLGISMVVAPAYLLHIKMSSYFEWFTFGVAEYVLQAILIIVLSLIVHKFKLKFLFSFVTAFLYGNVLDILMKLISFIPDFGFIQRIFFFVIGLLISSMGVSFFFHTYISPAAYEMFVKELATKYNVNISKVKTIYDCCSCLIAIIMSFVFVGFMKFEGVKAGTIICAFINGWLIGKWGRLLENHFAFKDAFALQKYFV